MNVGERSDPSNQFVIRATRFSISNKATICSLKLQYFIPPLASESGSLQRSNPDLNEYFGSFCEVLTQRQCLET